KKATSDAVSVKQPRCQEKAIFEFDLPSIIADFPKEHHSSSSSSFLSSAEKKYWLVGENARFRKTFRVSRETFNFILNRIAPSLVRETVTEEPITSAMRLAICLYTLGIGDYLYTISEMSGLGVSTVSSICQEVCQVLTEEEFKQKILDMEEFWQFPCCWTAIDCSHILMKCPPGELQACKEYHNFKNFYSIVLMAMVDSHY
ncbi:unnamed protein product, partial [Pocillopora meandrina]